MEDLISEELELVLEIDLLVTFHQAKATLTFLKVLVVSELTDQILVSINPWTTSKWASETNSDLNLEAADWVLEDQPQLVHLVLFQVYLKEQQELLPLSNLRPTKTTMT